MTPGLLKQMIASKLLDESLQVFLLDENNFSLIGDKEINCKIKYTERDQLPELNENQVRLVFWEELNESSASIDIAENIDNINLVINGNTFGCMDDWGFQAFTEYSFNTSDTKVEVYFNSESYGGQKDKVVYFIGSSGNCISIGDIDNNDDFEEELSEVFSIFA